MVTGSRPRAGISPKRNSAVASADASASEYAATYAAAPGRAARTYGLPIETMTLFGLARDDLPDPDEERFGQSEGTVRRPGLRKDGDHDRSGVPRARREGLEDGGSRRRVDAHRLCPVPPALDESRIVIAGALVRPGDLRAVDFGPVILDVVHDDVEDPSLPRSERQYAVVPEECHRGPGDFLRQPPARFPSHHGRRRGEVDWDRPQGGPPIL